MKITVKEILNIMLSYHIEAEEKAKGSDPANQLREEGAVSALQTLKIQLEKYRLIEGDKTE